MVDGLILGFALLWSFNCLLQFALISKFVFFDRAKDEKKYDHSMMYILGFMQFMEGIAFIIYAINESSDAPTSIGKQVFGCWQIVNSGNLWAFSIGQARAGLKFPTKIVWGSFMLASSICGIIFIILAATEHLKATQWLFIVCFEPPMFIMLSAMLGVAGSQQGIPGRYAVGMFIGFLIVSLAHLYTIMGNFAPQYKDPNGFPYTRGASVIGSVISNFCFYKLVKFGVYTEQPLKPIVPEESEVWSKPIEEKGSAKKAEDQGWTTYYVQPETIFSANPIFQFIGYCFCALIIFGYLKPNWLVDPIYLLYSTLHPCVLLDYVPANLVAMPTFTLAAVIAVSAVCLTFVRSVLLGDSLVSVFSGFVMGYFLIASSTFVLVFIFPPSISTLGHSLFYMIARAAEGLFMLNMGFVVLYRGSSFPGITFRQKQHFVLYVTASVCLVLYGLIFMGQRLLDDAAGRWKPETSEEIHIDPAPQIGAIVVIVVSFAYRFISPLTKFPIMWQMVSRSEAWDTKPVFLHPPAPEWGYYGTKSYARIKVRRPLAVAAFFLLISMILAYWSNKATWTQEVVEEWSLHEFMNKLPGSAVVATLLVPAQICLLYHVLLTIEHEWHHNTNIILRWASIVLGSVLFCTCLCASCSTTPKLPSWFRGAQSFEGMLCLWFLYHIVLALQSICAPSGNGENQKGAIELQEPGKETEKDKKDEPTIPRWITRGALIFGDLASAVVAIVFLICCMFELHAKYAVVWIVALQIWSICDCRKVMAHFGNITIVSQHDADKFGAWFKNKNQPKKLDEEQGGKPAEKEAAKPAEEKKETAA